MRTLLKTKTELEEINRILRDCMQKGIEVQINRTDSATYHGYVGTYETDEVMSSDGQILESIINLQLQDASANFIGGKFDIDVVNNVSYN